MKINKNLTFAALAALAITLLFQAPTARADDHGKKGDDNERGNRDHRDAKATFTKWVVNFVGAPCLIIDMEGEVGGAVGDGIFTGEVLQYIPGPVTKIVAFYHFTGPKHSFTALVRVEQTGSGPGTKAVIIGVVTDGWLKGHAVKGEYTEIVCNHGGLIAPNTTPVSRALSTSREIQTTDFRQPREPREVPAIDNR